MLRTYSIFTLCLLCFVFFFSLVSFFSFFFFFNDTATTEIYTLSLHDALPISRSRTTTACPSRSPRKPRSTPITSACSRSEEHTSELQSQSNLVCRLLLEKKKKKKTTMRNRTKRRNHQHVQNEDTTSKTVKHIH